jgi:type IV pilus assembly protein PilX
MYSSNTTPFSPRLVPRRERGAALFVALMVLILLSLLALSAAQVTGLQERMAGIYRADNLAFQSAEQRLRREEREVITDPLGCDLPPQAGVAPGWLDGTQTTAGSLIENLNNASSPLARGIDTRGSARTGQSRGPGSPSCMYFRVSTYAFDDDDARTSRAINQSTYTP